MLDTQFAEGLELFDDLAVSMLIISEVLVGRSDVIPEWRQMNLFMRNYAHSRGLKIAFQRPDYVPIVKALVAAETQCPKRDGLVSLTCAGKVVREALPGFKASDFGEGTLTDVLLATGQFEVIAIPHESGKGQSIYYRSIHPET